MCYHWPLQCVFKENQDCLFPFSEHRSCLVPGPNPKLAPFFAKKKTWFGKLSPLLYLYLFSDIKQVQLVFFFLFLPLLTSPDGYAIHRLECVQIRKIQRPPCLGRIHMFRHCCSFCGSTELVEKSNSGTCVPYVVQLSTVPSSLLVMRGGQGPDGHLANEQSRFPIAPGAASAFSQIIIRYMERLKC